MNTPSRLTITTFNLFNYLEPPNAYYDFENIYSYDEWSKKQGWIKNAIKTADSDIIGFQEVFSPASLEALVNEMGYPFFCVVDAPNVESDYLFRDPVVAIASRYPIKQTQAVAMSPQLLEQFPKPLLQEFGFNRLPVHATIDLPHLGLTDCYVVHFKSQRPIDAQKPETNVHSSATPNHSDTLTQFHQQELGWWLSSVQRGMEVQVLHEYITRQRHQSDRPVIMMGDFNKPLTSDEFRGLLNYSLNRNEESCHWLSHFRLRDSWTLYHQLHQEDLLVQRAPTHYYGASGSVLDYILLSNEFDCQNSSSLMEIIDYQVQDQHLINPSFEVDQFSTDHGVVSITAQIRSA
ncbi:endonuclease/exonuclease/phosphatase family protein [Vibrio sp. D404a]|uniref:endonuclease/exonuclease/phosphatase family protein n=1 Tax=unclassified Vibrio TaxID=2614977 RepID=UPI002554E8D7|nr:MULTISPECIES: endonuclease/exonuclease/phosphatase family protein [unclassified Vibrio]MDK9738238.1 endonuclease/exonuclease/phosphatase family protein [Vibrio sp. D404a]MDK9796529.1 endonuclease/exonuclease/phosphatase family protein [Vibrio sp. D449a]